MLDNFVKYIFEHLRHDEISDEDVELLNSRVLLDLPSDERAAFDDALCICSINASVDLTNLNWLRASNRPVLIVPAMHTGPGAAKRKEDDAERLRPKLLLMEGAKVMLTRNLWTVQGLTNGTMGIIRTNHLHSF
jgi:hypothetical protein